MISILSILPLDQLLIRPTLGLLLIGTRALIKKVINLDIFENMLVIYICEEELKKMEE